VQTEGMTADYFPHGVTKAAFTSLSCRHYYNVRVRYHKMNTIIQDEIVNRILYEHHMEFSSPTTTTNPGAVLLPTPFDLAAFTYPCLKQFQNSSDVIVHLTCNHRSRTKYSREQSSAWDVPWDGMGRIFLENFKQIK
ncbi:unnamed protein product, partial [Rotaria magnacalcarata]